jgi:hypothetical protein
MSDETHLRFLPCSPVVSCPLSDATLCARVPQHPLNSPPSPVLPLDATVECCGTPALLRL